MSLRWSVVGVLLLSGLLAGEGRAVKPSPKVVSKPSQLTDLAQTKLAQAEPERELLRVEGEITSRSLRHGDTRRYYNLHSFTGRAGQTVQIDLVSQDFDPYLVLEAMPLDFIYANNDNGGEGQNARITITLRKDGEYNLGAMTDTRGQPGRYRLTVKVLSEGRPTEPVVSESLVAEGTLNSESHVFESDGSYYDLYNFSGRAGETIQIDLMSQDFDALAILWGPDGQTLTQQDDGGEGQNARIRMTLPADGEYQIAANSYQGGEVGNYRLEVKRFDDSGSGASDQQPAPISYEGERLTLEGALTFQSPVWTPDDYPSIFAADGSSYYKAHPDYPHVIMTDGAYYEVHRFTGRAGEAIRIDLRSEEFEPDFGILNSDGEDVMGSSIPAWIDDHQITASLELPEDDVYTIVLGNLGIAQPAAKILGRYQLTLQPTTPEETARNKLKHTDVSSMIPSFIDRERGVELERPIAKLEEILELSRSWGDRSVEAKTLQAMGSTYALWDEPEQALEQYQQALTIYQDLGEQEGEAEVLMSLALLYIELGQAQQALAWSEQALRIYEALDQLRDITETLNFQGDAYLKLGNTTRALALFEQVVKLYQTDYRLQKEAELRAKIAPVYWELGDSQRAVAELDHALRLYRLANRSFLLNPDVNIATEPFLADRFAEHVSSVVVEFGELYRRWGLPRKALELYQELLTAFRVNDEDHTSGKASMLTHIGSIYVELGETEQAMDLLAQALPLYQSLDDRVGQAEVLSQMSLVYDARGQTQQAADYRNQALILNPNLIAQEPTLVPSGVQPTLEEYFQLLAVSRGRGDRYDEASYLYGIGRLYQEVGETQQALNFLNQSISLSRKLNRSDDAALNLIATIYNDLGDYQQALEYFNDDLAIQQAEGNPHGEVNALNNIGSVYKNLGDLQRALEFFNQALEISLQDDYDPDTGINWNYDIQATSLNNIGEVYHDLGQSQQALDYLQRSLDLQRKLKGRLEDRGREAIALNNLGLVYDELGETQKALDAQRQSSALFEEIGDRFGAATAFHDTAAILLRQNQPAEALIPIQRSIALTEQLRAATPPGELRQSYFATVQDNYQLYLDILIELHQQDPTKGYDAQAFQISESTRARILIEQLTEANIDIRQGIDPALLRQEQDLIQKLNAAEQQRVTLLNSGTASDSQIAQQIANINALTDDLAAIESRIRQASPTYAQLKFPEPLSLREIQDQVLDEETLLLEYALGEEKSYLFLVSKTGLTTIELPPQAEIEQAVEEYREKLQTPMFNDLSQGQALSEMLLGQVASQLGDKRLVIVSNGKLQLLPFGALPVPGASVAPLLMNHEIIALPSATSLAVQRSQWQNRQAAPKTIAMFADPVFEANDERFAANVQPDAPLSQNLGDLVSFDERTGCNQFRRLPYTATEAENILALVPDNQEFQAIGFAADHAAATDDRLKDYQILHLATHGCIQDNARLSGLALSAYEPDGDATQNQLLKLQDIYNLELNAELVVLSACQTGVGTEIQGEGVVGLTSGFLYAGAKRVVVSLWNVSDRGTADLMSDYYARMWEQEQKPGAALREAQLAAWNSGTKYSAPYYWAAFTMQGEF